MRYDVPINNALRTTLRNMGQEFGVTFDAGEIERIWIVEPSEPGVGAQYVFYDSPRLRVTGKVEDDYWETVIRLDVEGDQKVQQQFQQLIITGRA